MKSTVAHAFLRAVSPFVATSIPVVAHALSVPRRDSSRRLERFGCCSLSNLPTRMSDGKPRSRGTTTPPIVFTHTLQLAFPCLTPKMTKQTQFRRTPVKSTVAHAFLRAVSPFVATSIPVVAHALSVPRRDSSRRLGRFDHAFQEFEKRSHGQSCTMRRGSEQLPILGRTGNFGAALASGKAGISRQPIPAVPRANHRKESL